MNVANLELCRELHELSGWEDTYLAYVSQTTGEQHVLAADGSFGENWDFDWAYDLSYLLRKLPVHTKLWAERPDNWHAHFDDKDGLMQGLHVTYDTPEDAAAKLCVELIKQGLLTPKNERTESV